MTDSLLASLEGAERGAFDASAVNADAFWAKVDKSAGPDACWPWTGYIGSRGYGVFQYAKKGVARAHRIALALSKGPIPAGLLACHTCDNPPCCNPAHLWVGSDADNNRDRASKGRTVTTFGEGFSDYPRGDKHGSAKLSEAQALAIIESDLSGAALARSYGVSEAAISRVRSGKSWSHLRATQSRSTPEDGEG